MNIAAKAPTLARSVHAESTAASPVKAAVLGEPIVRVVLLDVELPAEVELIAAHDVKF